MKKVFCVIFALFFLILPPIFLLFLIQCYLQIEPVTDASFNTRMEKGLALLNSEQASEGALIFLELHHELVDSAVSLNNLGMAFMKLELFDKAEVTFKKLIEISPDFQLGINNLAWAKNVLADKRKQLENIKIAEMNEQFRMKLAQSLASIGNPTEMLNILEENIQKKLLPTNSILQLIEIIVWSGHLAEARALLKNFPPAESTSLRVEIEKLEKFEYPFILGNSTTTEIPASLAILLSQYRTNENKRSN
ncbi:MAG: hypothetical protein HQM08_03380 [Candidatus Riflebacteria bacterium]|nr:hypothetical protein [Candidatus Riflebacteria bacterium]